MATRAIPGGLLLLGSFGLGAAVMYLFDPILGRQRRAVTGDRARHLVRHEREILAKAGRDAAHRTHGLVERVRHPLPKRVPDRVLEGRVRSRIGRAVSHPSSIEVRVQDGEVVLSGPILTDEAPRLVRCVRAVPGARAVIDQLARHDSAEGVPGLQGAGRVARSWPRRETWSPSMQVAATGAGAALAAWGLAHRGRAIRFAAVTAGGALVLRSAANAPLARIVGRRALAVPVEKTITVHAPVGQVFDLWSHFEDLPLFMEHVRAVHVQGDDRRRSRWEVVGPAGTPIAFEAELTRFEPNRVIGWRTLPGQTFAHAGTVHFEDLGGSTRVHVQMQYRPPGGLLGHWLARLLGGDPKRRLDADLVRMKGLLETGKTRAHGHRVVIEELEPGAGAAYRLDATRSTRETGSA